MLSGVEPFKLVFRDFLYSLVRRVFQASSLSIILGLYESAHLRVCSHKWLLETVVLMTLILTKDSSFTPSR